MTTFLLMTQRETAVLFVKPVFITTPRHGWHLMVFLQEAKKALLCVNGSEGTPLRTNDPHAVSCITHLQLVLWQIGPRCTQVVWLAIEKINDGARTSLSAQFAPHQYLQSHAALSQCCFDRIQRFLQQRPRPRIPKITAH